MAIYCVFANSKLLSRIVCHCEEATFFVADVAICWKAPLLATALPRNCHVGINDHEGWVVGVVERWGTEVQLRNKIKSLIANDFVVLIASYR